MKEKDIKRKLDNDIEKMAPDILQNILSTPQKKIESEEELFGNNELLFQEKKKSGRSLTYRMAMAMCMCIILFVTVINPGMIGKDNTSVYAFSVNIDVNPSIRINVNKKGQIEDVKALNKDAKKLLAKIPDVRKENFLKGTKLIFDQCKKDGYLKNKKSAALITMIGRNKKVNKTNYKNLKKVIKVGKKSKGQVLFQNYKYSKKAEKLAKKHKVTQGKATLCLKVSKTKKKADKICDKDVYYLIKKAKKENVIKKKDIKNDNEDEIDEADDDDERLAVETEEPSVTVYTEDVTEEETAEEFTIESGEEETAEDVETPEAVEEASEVPAE